MPLKPSTATKSPFLISSQTLFIESTAGIPIALAKMALWLVIPPTSVRIALTFSLFICPVIEGVKSFAISTEPLATFEISTLFTPRSILKRLSLISFTSLALCCVSSSSTPENISINIEQTVSTAFSATEPESILSCICESINGSDSITICPSNISASLSPALFLTS